MNKEEYKRTFVRAYEECALWASTNENGEPLDRTYDIDDFSKDTNKRIQEDCTNFINDNWTDLKELSPSKCGHDFFLTRNRHGAGFWDRGLGKVGDRLTKASHPYGDFTLFPLLDGKIYHHG